MKLCSINGKEVWLLTIADLSKIVGLKSKTLRKWEKDGILPRPVVIEPMYSPQAGHCERRLYSEEQAKVLAAWVNRVRPGRGVSIKEPLIKMLHEKWNEVTEQFLKTIGG